MPSRLLGIRPLPGILQRVGHRQRIGLGAADLLGDRVGIVGEVDARIVRRVGLAQFFLVPSRRLSDVAGAEDQRLGDGEEVRRLEIVVELDGDVARQLEMLLDPRRPARAWPCRIRMSAAISAG